MTELEKMAEEWVHGPDAEIMDTWQAHKESFEAGFKKARELAAKELAGLVRINWQDRGKTEAYSDLITKLGESEADK